MRPTLADWIKKSFFRCGKMYTRRTIVSIFRCVAHGHPVCSRCYVAITTARGGHRFVSIAERLSLFQFTASFLLRRCDLSSYAVDPSLGGLWWFCGSVAPFDAVDRPAWKLGVPRLQCEPSSLRMCRPSLPSLSACPASPPPTLHPPAPCAPFAISSVPSSCSSGLLFPPHPPKDAITPPTPQELCLALCCHGKMFST